MDAYTVGARRLIVLIDGLPDGSLTHNQEHWGTATELQALTVEMLDLLVRQLQANGGVKKPKKPLQLPRPEYLRPKPEKKSAKQAYLDLARRLRR